MKRELICIVCPQGCRLTVEEIDGELKVSGNTCKRGEQYGITEVTAPTRVITSTVKLEGGRYPRLPVKTAGAVPKGMIFRCMEEIDKVVAVSPVKKGDVLLHDILGTGVDLVASRSL